MKIILLSGDPSSGKTTALNLLYDKLTKDSACKIIAEKQREDFYNAEDFRCALYYKGRTVAIHSCGDYYHVCVEAIVQYANVDVLVLAYSDKFKYSLKDSVLRYKNFNCIIDKKNKPYSKNDDNDKIWNELNEDVCEKIIKQIESL